MSSASAIVDSRWAMTNVVRPAITSRSAVLDLLLGRGVDGRRRVVEHEDPRVGQQRARDRQPLALAAGQRQPALADARVVAVGQLGDEAGRLRALGGRARPPRGSPPAARRRCCRATVAENRNGSSSTTAIARRSAARSTSRTSAPSTSTEPAVGVVQARDQPRRASTCPSPWRRPARPSCPRSTVSVDVAQRRAAASRVRERHVAQLDAPAPGRQRRRVRRARRAAARGRAARTAARPTRSPAGPARARCRAAASARSASAGRRRRR